MTSEKHSYIDALKAVAVGLVFGLIMCCVGYAVGYGIGLACDKQLFICGELGHR